MDACYIYSYQPLNNNLLSFIELLHFSDNAISSTALVEIKNYGCFTRNDKEKEKVIEAIRKITGIHLEQNQSQTVQIEWMEVFELNNKRLNSTTLKSTEFHTWMTP